MRVENLDIALRPRTAWEAVDLGVALTRRHARTIWLSWFAFTLAAFALANALCWLAFGEPWPAAILMWWAKPLFDRIPVYVLSRAVFGAAPNVRETLRAQLGWGLRAMVPWLLYRRFLSLNRAMLLPVDLLEGPRREARSARVRVLASGEGGQGIMLTIIALHIEGMLVFSIVMLVLMFAPVDFMADSVKAAFRTLFEAPPAWAQCVMNLVGWLATSVVEPFYVGAGFGLYLNRRTHLEAWDIELAFRRLATRLAAPALAVLLAFAAWPHAVHARADAPAAPAEAVAEEVDDADADAADDAEEGDDDGEAPAIADHVAGRAEAASTTDPEGTHTVETLLGSELAEGGDAFSESVARAYESPDLNRKKKETVWVERDPSRRKDPDDAGSTSFVGGAIAAVAAAVAESALWILLAVLAFLLFKLRHVWMPWLRSAAALVRGSASPVTTSALEGPAAPALPDDVPTAVRALWARGETRAALALLYRAAVESLVAARGDPLPPGATESECLRAAHALPGWSFADGFARIVACWRAAAYAKRMPDDAQLDALLAAFRDSRATPA
ncbi:MAG TPA: DUF4129 domain-containing protein [Xanthomonadales bacterium]|nr:DUF4129 domain-containing protein [Xanthomonadales bacterium]